MAGREHERGRTRSAVTAVTHSYCLTYIVKKEPPEFAMQIMSHILQSFTIVRSVHLIVTRSDFVCLRQGSSSTGSERLHL